MPDLTKRSQPALQTGPYQFVGFPQRDGELCFPGVGTAFNSAFGDKTLETTRAIETLTSSANGRWVHRLDACAGVIIMPFGSDANNETLDMRVTLWRWCSAMGAWAPHIALVADVTLGDQPVLGDDAIDLQTLTNCFWADTISVSPDLVPGVLGAQVLEPGTPDGTPSKVVMETFGAGAIEIEFTRASSTAASANALVWEF